MHCALKLHPDSRCDAVDRIEVEALRIEPDTLRLRFLLTGRLAELWLPPRAEPERADGLWRRTCFEAFVDTGGGYFELNLAPSTQWQAYRFSAYRSGMAVADLPLPRIDAARNGGFGLAADIPGLPTGPWRVGISAVVEDAGGRISYWALAHPPGRPDFHHADCFTLDLPPPERR
jgi:hypothetical protein